MLLNDQLLLDVYRRYLEILKDEPDHSQYADYGWETLPDTLSIDWLAYSLMLREFSRSLANIVNQIGNYARRLKSWDKALRKTDENIKLELLFEFVDPIATLALTLPYAIQCRFFFAIAHLSHQANKAKLGPLWRDDLPADKEIGAKTARKYAENWSSYASLETSVNAIFSMQHRINTDEFRHKNIHRVPTRVILGHAGSVRRAQDVKGGSVNYEFGARPPIDIGVLADELGGEFDRSCGAFQDFKALVAEHIEAIRNNNTLP